MEELSSENWDVIVIGTGMGGSTIGYSLASAGKKVLFLEKGRAYFRHADSIKGEFSDEISLRKENSQIPVTDILKRAGRYTSNITDKSGNAPKTFIPFLGQGSGGSTSLYGAVLERFHPEDFTPGRFFRKDSGSSLPEVWPVGYEDMLPFYEEAERLYHVQEASLNKRPDPVAEEMFSYLKKKNLTPYWLPVAHESSSECPGCQGFICPGHAKYDSVKACLLPALEQHGARLLEECVVLRLIAENEKIVSVECNWRDQKLHLKADLFILSAGALNTPEILLRSDIANSSGLVGKNLMRHYIDLYVIKTKLKSTQWNVGSGKDMAFNDFYVCDGEKLGTVQSFGRLPNGDVIASQMAEELPLLLGKCLSVFRPVMTRFFNSLFDKSYIFTSIIEDLPYPENRVFLDDKNENSVCISYRVNPEEKRRIEIIRSKLKKTFGYYRPLILKQAENNKRIAHACGTCRFGNDPKTSVLNSDNRTHDCENLYVVDSSFFPTAGGINPSLTIAANALRVAQKILKSY